MGDCTPPLSLFHWPWDSAGAGSGALVRVQKAWDVNPALDYESPVLLYQQLADILRKDIADGRLPAWVAVPSERKLMSRYQVTRTTVRSASGILNYEGMVVSKHRAGNFVQDPKADGRRVDARQVGMVWPAPPKNGEPAGSRAERAFRLEAILESAERRMKVMPWIAEVLQVEVGTEVLVQETTQASMPRALHPSAGPGFTPASRSSWGWLRLT